MESHQLARPSRKRGIKHLRAVRGIILLKNLEDSTAFSVEVGIVIRKRDRREIEFFSGNTALKFHYRQQIEMLLREN